MQEGLRKIIAIPLYILGFVFVGLLSGYLAFKVLSFSRTVEVPDLRGKTLVEANGLLIKNGLHLKVEGEDYDPVITPGLIVRQDVPAGNKVKERRGIKVFLSKGPKVWTIPELVGLTVEEAESVLSASGLRVARIIRLHSNTVENGRIIAQRPNPDEISESAPQDVDRRRGLSLVVSLGPHETIYYCPDFSGRNRDEAMGLAEKLGLVPQLAGSGETVRSQRPRPNSPIKTGETLYLHLEGG